MDIRSDNPDHGFQFPGRFELSAMGAIDAGLEQLVPDTLRALGLTVHADSLRARPSSKGNYIAVAIAFEAASRAEYDAAHVALRALPAVKWTL
jgi:uncharacterized protein